MSEIVGQEVKLRGQLQNFEINISARGISSNVPASQRGALIYFVTLQ